jgi:hypothetical protein
MALSSDCAAQLTENTMWPNVRRMEVHLPHQQGAQLNALAAQTGRGTDELVQEAVARRSRTTNVQTAGATRH